MHTPTSSLCQENTHNSGSPPNFLLGPVLITWPGRAPLWAWAPGTLGQVLDSRGLVPPQSLPSAWGRVSPWCLVRGLRGSES